MTNELLVNDGLEEAYLGGGCFWCLEAVFQKLQGVQSVVSGYMGGHVQEPSYEQVCSKTTGHAEVVRVCFDPKVISYRQLLDVFFEIHDPTTPNRQGNDVGPQYRSMIVASTEAQRLAADGALSGIEGAVTELLGPSPMPTFWPAEAEHHDYYRRNPYQGYCVFVVAPKVIKAEQKFTELIAR
jgi:peptide-methionine (S)-S-oxide reductase